MTGLKDDLVDATNDVMNRLRTRLVGLSDEEYFWEPAPNCWTVRPDDTGSWRGDWESPAWPPPFTTIAWRLGHIINNLFDQRYATHLGLQPMEPPPSSLPSTARDAIALVDRGCSTTGSYLRAMDEATLAVPLGPGAGPWAADDRASFVLHILDELTHHAAEVALLRDLYRATQPENPLIELLLSGDAGAARNLIAQDRHLLDRARSEWPDLLVRAAGPERYEGLPLLLELGFPIALPDGNSALHYAAGAGRGDAVDLLRDAGGDLTTRDSIYRATPKEWAAFFGHDGLADTLS